jgi:diguanylate cyclase (GGDEF)-like protein
VLFDTIGYVTSTLSLREVLQRLLYRTLEHLRCEIGSILLVEGGDMLRVAIARGLPDEVLTQGRFSGESSISGYVIETGEPLLVDDIETDSRFGRRNHERYYTHSLISAPMVFHGEVRGVINVNNKHTREPLGEDELRLLEAIAGHAAAALSNALNYEALLERAQHDALTGLANHGHFWSSLDLELSRATRYGRPLGLVMLDVDHFKRFNDQRGHVAGDDALQLVAKLIRESTRAVDLAARYGGEEFAVILPETPPEGALVFGEKIRRHIEGAAIGGEPDEPLTVSVGVSSFPTAGENAAALVEAADQQLYRAKHQGRNRVCSSGGDLPSTGAERS